MLKINASYSIKITCALIITFMLSISIAGTVKPLNSLDNSVEAIAQYCRNDFQGARLSSETWGRVSPFIEWEDEPGWDAMIVVSGFRIGKPKIVDDKVEIAVTYDVVGSLSGEEFSATKSSETISFKLRKVGLAWKIIGPVIPPHVSKDGALRSVLDILKEDVQDDTRKRNLQTVARQLRDLK